MAGLDVPPHRFVRIAGPNGALGTGFRISPTRVLTGHHVVQGKERIWVLDPDPKDARKWLGSEDAPAKIVWAPEGDARAEEALDAAVLATEPVGDLSPFTRLLSGELPATSNWESYGFPKSSAATPADRHLLEGTTAHFPAHQEPFSLTVLSGLPDNEEGWIGISGAPVLAQTPVFAGWTLVGVLRKTFAKFGRGRIQAIALPALLTRSGFREALALPDVQSRCSGLLYQASDLLASKGLAAEVVRHHEPWQAVWKAGDPARLAEALCIETSLGETAEALVNAYCGLMDQSKNLEALHVIELLYCALSVGYLSRTAENLPDRQATEVELDVTLAILVEIANAAIDGRPVALTSAPFPESDYPPSLFDASERAEAGVDPEGLLRTEDLGRRLLKAQAVRPETGTLNAEERALRYIKQIAQATLLPVSIRGELSSASPQEKRDAVFRLVNKRVAREAKRHGRFYLIARDDSPDEHAFLEQLRLRLSELRRVFRNRASEGLADRLEAEDEVGEPLQRLFLRQAQNRRDRKTEDQP